MTGRDVKNTVPSDDLCDLAVLARRHLSDPLCVTAASVLAYVLEAINVLTDLSVSVAASLLSVRMLNVDIFGCESALSEKYAPLCCHLKSLPMPGKALYGFLKNPPLECQTNHQSQAATTTPK